MKNYIVFDLEATCWDASLGDRMQEIIEIAAIHINAYGEETSRFQRFVKPVKYPRLSHYCTTLTSIEQEDIDKSKHFDRVFEDFRLWVETVGEDSTFVSWGDYDLTLIADECSRFRVDFEGFDSYMDCKKAYRKIKKLPKPVGMAKAIRMENWEFIGTQHRADDDTYNLARIVARYFEEWPI